MPKANSRGFLNPWVKDGSLEIRLEDAGRQRVQGHESPSVFISPSFRRPWCMGRLYTTDLKVRGYLYSRLPDEFSNSATNLFVRGCEKDTKSKPIQPHLFRMVSR